MRIEFTKMHGLGNDFVVIDLVTQRLELTSGLIRRLADRHTGIGFDQLLIVLPPSRPDVDFNYQIFNADGSEVEQCGNGIRCFARFVHERRLSRVNPLRVLTSSGIAEVTLDNHHPAAQGSNHASSMAQVNMGLPRFHPAEIPFKSSEPALLYPLGVADQTIEIGVVNMGNPHAIWRVNEVEQAPVPQVGPLIESHPLFPQRVNAGFMQVISRRHIRLRVYERGAGETRACGTGACAAVVHGIRMDWLDETVQVDLPGGRLQISWRPDEPVWMVGPATTVFEGYFYSNDFADDSLSA